MEKRNTRGFSLIEVIVTMFIIAIGAVAIILIVNPPELAKRARDSNRLADLQSLNKAIAAYSGETAKGRYFGAPDVVYVSIPDPAATPPAGTNCAGMGLPTLPTGYSYHCAGPSAYRNTDGTGWVPVNLSNVPSLSSMGALPIDPINTAASRSYYSYMARMTGDSNVAQGWRLGTNVESRNASYQGPADKTSTDGGFYPTYYEIGNAPVFPILPTNLLKTESQNLLLDAAEWLQFAYGSPPSTPFGFGMFYPGQDPDGALTASHIERTPFGASDNRILYQQVSMKKGENYKLFVWMKKTVAAGPDKTISIGFLDTVSLNASEAPITVTSNWQLFSHDFTPIADEVAHVRVIDHPGTAGPIDFLVWGAQLVKL